MGEKISRRTKARLAGRRSPQWAFMEKFVVPDYSRPELDEDYLTRWRLINTPLFGIYLHKIETPDPRPTLHDHPWAFTAIVLRGGYTEMRRYSHVMGTDKRYAGRNMVRRINMMPLDSLHWIERLHRTPTWTLVFVGRRKRVWGYLDRDGTYTEFHKHEFNNQFLDALAQREAHKLGRQVTEEERIVLNQWDKKAL